jgi:hypothetical protein
MFFKDKKASDGSERESRRIWFKVVYVFDISQTDGTVQCATLDKAYLDTPRLREHEQSVEHILAAFANRLGWQFWEGIAVIT